MIRFFFLFFSYPKNTKNRIFQKMQILLFFSQISSFSLIFCYFSHFFHQNPFLLSKFFRFLGFKWPLESSHAEVQGDVQERDSNITFVTNFSCGSVWKREILMKIGSRWTQNCKNGTSQKIMIFFIFCLYRCKKWKNMFFWRPSSFLIKNHWKNTIFGFLWLRKMQKM